MLALSKVSEELERSSLQNAENCRRRQPCSLTPPILESLAYIFAADSMGLFSP